MTRVNYLSLVGRECDLMSCLSKLSQSVWQRGYSTILFPFSLSLIFRFTISMTRVNYLSLVGRECDLMSCFSKLPQSVWQRGYAIIFFNKFIWRNLR